MYRRERCALGVVVLCCIVMNASVGFALDGAKDRRGLFWGMGFGGGGAVLIPESKAGGEINFDLQLGAGVTQYATLAFDVDIYTVIFDEQRNVIINPGPEINYFFGESGIFVRANLGAAMNIVRVGNKSDFSIGFDAGVGFGWEFFANTNLAIGVALEADYIVRRDDDLTMFGFMFSMRYY